MVARGSIGGDERRYALLRESPNAYAMMEEVPVVRREGL